MFVFLLAISCHAWYACILVCLFPKTECNLSVSFLVIFSVYLAFVSCLQKPILIFFLLSIFHTVNQYYLCFRPSPRYEHLQCTTKASSTSSQWEAFSCSHCRPACCHHTWAICTTAPTWTTFTYCPAAAKAKPHQPHPEAARTGSC